MKSPQLYHGRMFYDAVRQNIDIAINDCQGHLKMNHLRKYVTIAVLIGALLSILFFATRKQNVTGSNQDVVTVDGQPSTKSRDEILQKSTQPLINKLLTHDQLLQVVKKDYPHISSLAISCSGITCDLSGTFATDDLSKRDQFSRMVNGGLGRIILESGYKPAADLKVSAADESVANFSTQFYNESGN